jgi:hypothetical protein
MNREEKIHFYSSEIQKSKQMAKQIYLEIEINHR